MVKFLFKGLIRDRNRSLLPILITAAGVALTVLGFAWVGGMMNDMVETSAKFSSGHLKVQTRALFEKKYPNIMELVLADNASWRASLAKEYPELRWTPRITFGGLLDVPDDKGDTISQAPVMGIAVDLFAADGLEVDNLNLKKCLVKGALPRKPGEVLISDDLFGKLDLELGQTATLISSDMNGSMAVYNLKISGTIVFGIAAMDRGAMVADVADIQEALNMLDASTEILGFFKSGRYQPERAEIIKEDFNPKNTDDGDIFSPVMATLETESEMGQMIGMARGIFSGVIIVFVLIVSIVLWNMGLMNGIRRYGEIGIRLAIGESKGHLYLSLVLESLMIGIIAYVLGTVLGVIPAYYLQVHGIDMSEMMTSASSVMMSNVMRAHVTSVELWIGIIPGVAAPFIGSLVSGLGIFRRDTSQLFKELEV